MSRRGDWLVIGAALAAMALVFVLAVVATRGDARFERECSAAGGYVEEGRRIRLCIGVDDGRIIRLPSRS